MTALLCACASTPDAPDAPAQTAANTTSSEPLICTSETVIGSHVPTTTCMTRSQRKQAAQNSQDSLDEIGGH